MIATARLLFRGLLVLGIFAYLWSNELAAKDGERAITLAVSNDDAQKAIAKFSKQMAKKHGFDEQQLFSKLSSLKPDRGIIARITRPAESLPWYRYRKIFITDKRIEQGVQFWNDNADTLDKVAKQFAVDPEIIVGIIGVETFYGRIQGDFSVFSALHTLGFYYPKRAGFFLKELEQYLILARAQDWELLDIKGSYAGAMGMGQFISSSYTNFGVDYNNDGHVNLFDDKEDMIASVANYFKRHGWVRGGFVAQKIEDSHPLTSIKQQELKLSHSVASLKSKKLIDSDWEKQSEHLGVFAFDADNKREEYWLVGDNFYTITRYNRSSLYALAAYQLSQLIKAKRESRDL
ncbi:lytic murein transglycosylase B [Aliikangiella sp. G2MR2-5]|uniref:lytic murein transglycosylase B n=1 Tax=Aliikangiella sp. G2MR2-5 TaxID=2788943 RepID=UPI0018A8FF34|nr:lytic murein transglycosylase B [Aliikangiella sp. G2MR2-5]